jgi:hypothetical protein
VYPEHNWNYNRKPAKYWQDISHQRTFFENLASKLNIQKPEDWYKVSIETFVQHGGAFVNNYYQGSLVRGISEA